MLSWRLLIKPPRWQFMACVTVYWWLHGHFEGRFFNGLSYRRFIASWNSPRWRSKFWSFRGRALSQLEAPGSLSCSRFRIISALWFSTVFSLKLFSCCFLIEIALSFAFTVFPCYEDPCFDSIFVFVMVSWRISMLSRRCLFHFWIFSFPVHHTLWAELRSLFPLERYLHQIVLVWTDSL